MPRYECGNFDESKVLQLLRSRHRTVAAVNSSELLNAVEGILAKVCPASFAMLGPPSHLILDLVWPVFGWRGAVRQVDLSLSTEHRTLMEETLQLRDQLRCEQLAAIVAPGPPLRLTCVLSPCRHASRDLEQAQVRMADLQEELVSVPDEFRCPITREIMEDPVICSDGHTYDRQAITRWLSSHGTSPKTNQRLANREVIPNHTLRALIAVLRERRGDVL